MEEITISEDELSPNAVRSNEHLSGEQYIGIPDAETEAVFGKVVYEPRVLDRISQASKTYWDNEIGGVCVSYADEAGVDHVVEQIFFDPVSTPEVYRTPTASGVSLSGTFNLFAGMEFAREQLAHLQRLPAYEGLNLQIREWWHSHPPGSDTDDAYNPIPGPGDFAVNSTIKNAAFPDSEPRMLIVKKTGRDVPLEMALWRWDSTEGDEGAVYQSGVPVSGTTEMEYWAKPDRLDKVLKREADEIVALDLDSAGNVVDPVPETITVDLPADDTPPVTSEVSPPVQDTRSAAQKIVEAGFRKPR